MKKAPAQWKYLLLITALLTGSLKASAQSDTLFLDNGMRLVGTLNSLEKESFSFDHPTLGSLSIPQGNVIGIIAPDRYDVVTTYGSKFMATLKLSNLKGKVNLVQGDTINEVDISNILTIRSLKSKKSERLSGLIRAGFSYTESSNVLQINWGGEASYRSFRNIHSASYNGLVNRTSEDVNQRQNFTYNYNRKYNRGWFLYATSTLEQNTQLNIQFRGQFAGGGGKYFIRNNDVLFSGVIAINSNNEVTLDEEEQYSLEGLIGIRYNQFNLTNPDLDITSSINFYPSLTEDDRYRMDLNLNLSYNIISDLSVNVTFVNNFDSKTPSTGERKNDFNIVLSAGYSL